MEDKTSLLILRLEGALQSWGDGSKWDLRDSAATPGKSAVVGLLGCALGLARDDPELNALNAALIHMAVRTERPGKAHTDFQTVTGDPLLNAAGKKKSGGNTFISPRVYLEDACFTVFLELKTDWHDRVAAALRDPVWCMYLGHKCCVPSRPVLECAEPPYASLEEAVYRYPTVTRRDAGKPMSIEWDIPRSDFSTRQRADEIAEGYRSFALRTVWIGSMEEKNHDTDEN